uniref:Uncharacterized protein n=1 Tax=Aegilops tauschii subsp. strangulata TaxID=200361 RepID=A0A453QJJ2_AEGTS
MPHRGGLLPLLLVALAAAPLAVAWRPWPPRDASGALAGLGASKKFEGSSDFVKLEYHMGPVLAADITVHPIWYGAWPAEQKRTIRAFLRSLSPQSSGEKEGAVPSPSVADWWRTVRLYTDQTTANVSAVVALGQEKCDARMSRGASLTRMDGMVSVIAHELAEMASNPLANAWYAGGDPSFPTEIADLCEGIYGTGGGGAYTGQLLTDGRSGAAYNLNGVGGRRFLVQWVWDPYRSYCSGPNALDHQ